MPANNLYIQPVQAIYRQILSAYCGVTRRGTGFPLLFPDAAVLWEKKRTKPEIGGIEEIMGRREQREQIFKLLFRVEFNPKEEMPEQCQLFFEDEENGIGEKDAAYIQGKFEKIQDKLPEIDEMINTTAKGWTTSRMGKVDLTIIRLAVYEIKFDEEVPDSVAINEAVELAKKFGQDESAGFVNGVLARFV